VLTVKKIGRLTEPGRYGDGHGLYLQVVNRNNRSWIFRWERGGHEHWMGLGPLHTFNLDQARERAREARQKIRDGIDPLQARREAEATARLASAKAMSFAEAAEQFVAQNESGWSNAKHRRQVMGTLRTFAFPIIGALPVAGIDTGLVLRVLEQPVAAERGNPAGPFWIARPETASRVRGRVEAVLAWATVRGHRSGDNPAAWRNHLDQVLPKQGRAARVEHHAALPYAQLPAFMAELRAREGVAARALEFTILVAARSGEVAGARWSEIDLETATFTVPGARMKSRKEHRAPLPVAAVELLAKLPREDGNPRVFIGSRRGAGLGPAAMSSMLARMGRGDVTVHGFRSAFRDWAAERTNYANHVVEQVLAHSIGSAVEKAYRRGDLLDQRRKIMELWGGYCSGPAVQGGAVVPMRR
jgi:integrase